MAQGQGTNILSSLLRAKRFSQGFLKAPNAPTVSELDTPVTLARTRLIPDDAAGFDRRVRVYGTGWAKVSRMTRKLVAGKTSGIDITHEITLRHDPDYTIDERDMIFVESQIYVAREVRGAERNYPFVTVMTTHAGSMDEHDLTLVEPGDEETVPLPEPEDDPTLATDFPEWS